MEFLAITFTLRDILLMVPIITIILTMYLKLSIRINTLEIELKNMDDKQTAFEKVYNQDNSDAKDFRKSIMDKLDQVSRDIADVRVIVAKVPDHRKGL